MLRAFLSSTAIILGAAILVAADDARVPDKPITADERDHWAFRPPVRVRPPVVEHRGWIRNPIDAFILAGLESNGLRPAPEADRPALLRRLSFDLTGLPPSPEESRRFSHDRSANAYEKARRSPAGQPALWGTLGAALARPGALRRDRRLRVRPGSAQCLALSRLGRAAPSTATCLMTTSSGSNWPATRSRPGDPARLHRDRLQPLLSRHGRPERPGTAAPERAQRHHRDHRPGLPGPDDRLCPLPRPQVRPDPPGRFLPAPGVLRPAAVPR